ncbi:helix-turn-helix domain-containing protein [Pinirhizobacter sp.]|uniref:helix-turn-helix domain-containing protein n=1 Tax=Pinirhizobacter sp. TaxID=2950432 RepID=UPI002F419FC7
MNGNQDHEDLFRADAAGAADGEAAPEAPIETAPDVPDVAEHRFVESVVFAPRFGDRLRAAREARGLDIEACTHQLRLPSRLLRQLEAGEYNGIDYQVYLAGYLSKYGRFLGVDEAAIAEEIEHTKSKQPTLVVTGGISHSRYLLDRYMTAAQYVVLTAVIVVPLIWFGVRGTFDRDLARLAPLDASPVTAQQDTVPAASTSVGANAVAAAAPVARPPAPTPVDDQQPLLASMAIFPNMENRVTAPKVDVPAVDAASAVGQGSHTLSLTVPSASWVEVLAADGSRLEYGLLPAGTTRSYRSDGNMDVRIGNATGAQAMVDGKPVALDGFRRANVARFKVDVHNGQAQAVGGAPPAPTNN